MIRIKIALTVLATIGFVLAFIFGSPRYGPFRKIWDMPQLQWQRKLSFTEAGRPKLFFVLWNLLIYTAFLIVLWFVR